MSKDDLIRIRAENELKERLKAIAKRHRTDFSEFVRQRLWAIVEEEEKRAGNEAAQWLAHAKAPLPGASPAPRKAKSGTRQPPGAGKH